MIINWLEAHARDLSTAIDEGRRAHAYLISGARGTGKRALAHWFARRVLGGGSEPVAADVPPPVHPDFLSVTPEPDKTGLSIEQIRALIAEFTLTSHQGGARVAVLEPADSMSRNAANSLLKTLEEPSGDSLIILVADRLQYLPATVLSRCIHVKVRRPRRETAQAWLSGHDPDVDWPYALALAHNGPLLALALAHNGELEQAGGFADDFERLLAGAADPVAVAAAWHKAAPAFALRWLVTTVDGLIRWRMTGQADPWARPRWENTAARRIDLKNLFCYQDGLLRYINRPRGTYNELLALESLLIAWHRRLEAPATGIFQLTA
ncbi:MAG: hypothetical protein AAFX58_08665 [Pseudomonadota bacterium]